jgi:2-oxo-3-(phosphooxy)propyl 3-oxoalkanoate synthase
VQAPSNGVLARRSPLPARDSGLASGAVLDLSFDRTVPRELVHKSGIAEVFLTDHRPLGDLRFACGAQLPLMHAFYSDSVTEHHPLQVLTEATRQATILVAEQYLDLPSDHRALLHDVELNVEDPDAIRVDGCPATAEILVELVDCRETAGAVSGFTAATRMALGDLEAVTGVISASVQTATTYRDMRRHQRAARALDLTVRSRVAPCEPRACGKRRRSSVLIARPRRAPDGALEAALAVDLRHPSLFDHEQDHLPGMLLLEAATQIAIAAAAQRGGAPTEELVAVGCRAEFGQFAELELPVACRARLDRGPNGAPAHVDVSLEQPDAEVCHAVVDVARVDPDIETGDNP